MNCPKCDCLMEHEGYDPSVGIMRGYYYCSNCDDGETYPEEVDDFDDAGWEK